MPSHRQNKVVIIFSAHRRCVGLVPNFMAKFKIIVAIITTFFVAYFLLGWTLMSSNRTAFHQQIPIDRNLTSHLPMPVRFRGKKLPFHKVYESRQVGTYYRESNSNDEDAKIILLWTPWNSVRKTINYYFLRLGNRSFVQYRCPVSNCIVVRDKSLIAKSDAIFFHLLDVKIHDLPQYRRSDQTWILYNMEPPWLIRRPSLNLEPLNGIFNLSMSYRDDSDITVKYGLIEKNRNPQNMSSNLEDIWIRKTRSAIWMASDCKTDSHREDYVTELRKYISVDRYGLCGEKKCFPSQSKLCYDELLTPYKFYLSFENAICQDYVTEKFFNVFNYDIIPVVFGGANYSRIATPGSYLLANEFPNPQDLALEMTRIGSNATLYASYLKRKLPYKAFLDPWTCRLCERLHTTSKSSTIKDIKGWWISNAKCQHWNQTNAAFQ